MRPAALRASGLDGCALVATSLAGLALVLGCSSSAASSGGGGGGAAQGPGPGQGPASVAAGGGDPWAGRAICEAMCRRSQRCGEGADHAECFRSCAARPPRHPPAWRADFTRMAVGCLDQTSCAHDADEVCMLNSLAAMPALASARACDQRRGARMPSLKCAIYNGLTPSADAWFAGCLQLSGGACHPPHDWK